MVQDLVIFARCRTESLPTFLRKILLLLAQAIPFKSPRRKALAVGAIIGLLFVGVGLTVPANVPAYAGRPVNAWLEDLCSGIGVDDGLWKKRRFDSAYHAFTRMESDAVPYLTKQLQYDRSGVRQKALKLLLSLRVTQPYAINVLSPEQRRVWAAVALRQMGSNAEKAIPSLLESWAHDTMDVKRSAVSALEGILHGNFTRCNTITEWNNLETAIIAEASRRYPRVTVDLGK